MNNVEIKYLITALADDEIRDDETRKSLLEKIRSDKGLSYEYFVQVQMKKLISGMKRHPAPPRVRRRVFRRLWIAQLWK